MTDALKPCPFCAAGKTDIHPNGRMWTGQRLSEPTSVSIRHWCEDVAGQPHRMIERVGRDEAAAIEAWNRRAALAAPPVAPGWVPIETAPKDGTLALLYSQRGRNWYIGAWRDYQHHNQPKVTHWMPLPAAPGAPDAQQKPKP